MIPTTLKNAAGRQLQRGYGNEHRPVVKTLWERDSRPAEPATLAVGDFEPDRPHVDFARYYERSFMDKEIERVWSRSWLYAAREEDIPEVGDRVPFDCGPLSFVLVRTEADAFKAFYNSCPHRGTRLCNEHQNAATIRCPYHGWEWHTSGKLKGIPSHWDFPEITPLNGGLREARIESWGGFLFINADADAPPLVEALSVMPEHFAKFGLDNRYTAARFRKLVKANWKVAQEAFMESYHVYATHPQGVPYNGDSQTQYDLWETGTGHVARQTTPSAVPSMHAPSEASAIEAAQVYAMVTGGWHYPEFPQPELDPQGDVRAQIGEWHRQAYQATYGRERHATDGVMLDSLLYFMFPHAVFWLAESLPFTYQFTPHPSDPELSFFEVRLLRPIAEGAPRPPSSPAVEVGPEERIEDKVPAFGLLGTIFDQDMTNMPLIQRGMHAAPADRAFSTLGKYQEMIIQHWNEVLDALMADPAT
ncbi:Rieske 2Fe-2S domain-containing protein [Novosphingobium sp. 9U]|uniref:aromatic ring-hydroxylating oxygenase subunit alpha n=1 Tax=Novosphingobium sp. 9U TaxID=2653158 RepID=UPI0012F26C84|nr:aromatic ring-hydroxylating dioxygenase subunit alpha [Novosphingobium sp. 9U]VWX50116.1 Rieske (2Fe-2S) domain-containing protein [Novosphingobium sp. 9U]